MLSRTRCWGLSILFFGAISLRAFAARWAPFDTESVPWPQWLIGLTVSSLVPAAVALLGWSRLPDRPQWVWLAAVAATVFPPAVGAGATASPLSLIALVVTSALIDFDILLGPRAKTPQRASSLWLVPMVGLLATACAWWLIRGSPMSDLPHQTVAKDLERWPQNLAIVLNASFFPDSAWNRIESVSAIALAIASLMGAAIWFPHRLSLWPLGVPPIVVGTMLIAGYAHPPWRIVSDPVLIVLGVGALTPLVGRPMPTPAANESPTSPQLAAPPLESAAIVAYPMQKAAAARSQRRAG